MKIVEIIPQLSSGGAERFVVDLCNELSKRHEVTLIVYYNISEYGFYVRELVKDVQLVVLNKKKGIDLFLMRKLTMIIKRINPDIVHLHTRAINYALPVLLGRNRIKKYMTIHSVAEKEAGNLVERMIRKYCFGNGLITPVTISMESLNSFVEYYGFNPPMIPNGRDINGNLSVSEEVLEEIDGYRNSDLTKVLVCVARLTSVKRQDLLARVVKRLSSEGYDLCVLLIGRPLERDVLDRVMAVDCKNVYMLGEKKNPMEYLKVADAFCLCSIYEGMPISLIEALGLGVVPVCTPVGGVVNIINGSNGFLSSDTTEESYYFALKKFLDTDIDTLKKIKIQAKFSYQPYTMKECAKKYESLFNYNNI